MFAGIVSRDNGEPWPAQGMTSAKWRDVPVDVVYIASLYATQPGVLFHALGDDAPPPVGGDPLPHVIDWQGLLYLEDGHSRVVRAALRGNRLVCVRRLRIPPKGHTA